MFVEYGDDSVAQLGGVHLACEQASNILTKVLEWGRLMSYLEQSTRYIAYDARLGGRYRFYRDPAVLASRLGTRYVGDMDRMFDAYSQVLGDGHRPRAGHRRPATRRQRLRLPPGDAGQGARRRRAACCRRRRCPTSASTAAARRSRRCCCGMRAHPLPEARDYGELMLHELRKVIPSFLRRVDLPERGGRWSDYLATHPRPHRRAGRRRCSARRHQPTAAAGDARRLRSRRRGQAAGGDLLPALQPARAPAARPVSRRSGTDERLALVRAYVGDRENRRHKPGRAFERVDYRFDVLSDYGAFRDLQRHRMLTIEWQPLTPDHGYVRPDLVDEAGQADAVRRRRCTARPTSTTPCTDDFPEQAPYAVAMAYRVRYVMQFNAREAIHLLELRSGAQGHPAYRRIALEMHRLIAEQAGHRAVAEAMTHLTTEAARAGTPRRRAAGRGPPPILTLSRHDERNPVCDLCHEAAPRAVDGDLGQ